MYKYEEDMKMPYVTSIERMGIIKGRKEGIEEGIEKGKLKIAREAVIDVLEARFEAVPKTMLSPITCFEEKQWSPKKLPMK
jgi:flagellar biosynthesis/type III secretory pathway protein FliH